MERLIRPMIRASRADVLAHVERHGLSPCQDPSNKDLRFLRVQVRAELLPLLEKLGPGALDHLVELSDEAFHLPEPLGLNREQRRQIRQALRDPAVGLDLKLPGGISLTRILGQKFGNKSAK
jgi:tRNA(Ile)-lysidine synthase TilS/MesJ